MMHAKIGDSDYALINIYNPNTENEQLRLLADVGEKMDQLDIEPDTNVILGGDFNFFFDKTLETDGGNPRTKLQSLASFIKIKEKFDLCDIWRVQHPTEKRFTFRQNRNTGKLQSRIDYLFVSNHLQASACNTDIKVAMCTDHSPVYLDLSLENIHLQRGSGFWKYNTTLKKDPIYKENLRALIREFLETNHNLDGQSKWELLKYEVKRYTFKYTSKIARDKQENKIRLENQIACFNTENVDENDENYKKARDDLEKIYSDQAAGIRMRSKCEWYELGEKSNKYFLNLEKKKRHYVHHNQVN